MLGAVAKCGAGFGALYANAIKGFIPHNCRSSVAYTADLPRMTYRWRVYSLEHKDPSRSAFAQFQVAF
jgi:hypothetical protein